MTQGRKLRILLVTGRTIEQGVGKECGKYSEEYLQSVSVCYLDPEDFGQLGIKERANVRVSTDFGSVVVKALKSPRTPHPGVVFFPYGPWANAVVDPDTSSIGMPSLKGIPVVVEPEPDEPSLTLSQLLKKEFGKESHDSY